MNLFPVALFVYNRPDHLRLTLEALSKNTIADQTDIYIYSDGGRSEADLGQVNLVRNIAHSFKGFNSIKVIERPQNLGLAASVISGVTELLNLNEAVIVLEDDLVTSRHFLQFMNDSLRYYQLDSSIFSVTGHVFPERFFSIPPNYSFDTFTSYRCSSWSWGVWKDRWAKVDWSMAYFDKLSKDSTRKKLFNRGGEDLYSMLNSQYRGEIDSWAIRFCYAHFSHNAYCVYPTKTLVKNIGLDHSGVHGQPNVRYTHEYLDEHWLPSVFCPAESMDSGINKLMYQFFGARHNPLRRLLRATKTFLKNKLEPLLFNTGENSASILFVSAYLHGGAGIAAYRLFQGMSQHLDGVKFLTLLMNQVVPGLYGVRIQSLRGRLIDTISSLQKIIFLRYQKTRKDTLFTFANFFNPFRIDFKRFHPKLIHLHWAGDGLLPISSLNNLPCPVVWTLHDAYAFTGGCYYPGDCTGYLYGCGKCPQLGSTERSDVSAESFDAKQKAYSSINLTIVSPSKWLASVARSSKLLYNKRIEVIPNGIDMSRFLPEDKKLARKHLGIEHDLPTILIGSQLLNDERKGFDLFMECIEKICSRYALMYFGSGDFNFDKFPDLIVHKLGEIKKDSDLIFAYSAANVFVCPSRQDNLPNTILESMACGTPAVAFRVGGVEDLIEHSKSGWLADPFSLDQLADGIDWVIQHPQYDNLCSEARKRVKDEFSLDVMIERYMKLYAELIPC